ncbi:MAG: type II secretion system F family protein [Nocardioidaceae bacterium]|nr:type II secretion system F family protein [Nocardioidaceae bacterium]NUS52246.1 type II secretion system F family protein [Nocardioidaceae bacterium]
MLRLVAAAALAAGLWAVLGGGLGLLLGGGSAVACWVLTGRLEPAAVRRRRERIAADLPHVVDLLSACLAAGHSPATAVDEVRRAVDPPVREELDALHARLRLGVDPVGAWRDLSRHPQLGPLGRTVARAVESGASVSDAMLRLGEDLRARNRAEVEARARAVGVKAAVPLGVCLLPAFVLVGVVPLVAGSLSVLLPR